MNDAISIIKQKIKTNKHITLYDFIAESLYGTKGYYNCFNPFSYTEGDFITSPNISQIFGETVAMFILLKWEALNKPKKFILVELGAGTAIMILDILNFIKHIPMLYDSLQVVIIEQSEKLRIIQTNNIIKHKDKIIQISSLTELNDYLSDDMTIFFIANEFFDAFPINQYVYKKQRWYIKNVVLDNFDNFMFYDEYISQVPFNVEKINIDDGQIVEHSSVVDDYIHNIKSIIKKNSGGALFIDYGSMNKKYISTVRSFYKHTMIDIFSKVGTSDITYSLDFNIFGEYKNYYTQRDFLIKYGIEHIAQKLSQKSNYYEKYCLGKSLNKLTDINDMGTKFKVIEL